MLPIFIAAGHRSIHSTIEMLRRQVHLTQARLGNSIKRDRNVSIMTSCAQVLPCEMVWQYPRTHGGAFELSAGELALGRLQFDGRPGAPSLGELRGEKLVFQHTGTTMPGVTVRGEAGGESIAEFVPAIFGGGAVSFPSGACYSWKRVKVWGSTWCFRRQGESNPHSICVALEAGPLQSGGRVKVCADAAALPETPILVLLAWYLRVLAFELLGESIPGIG